jgi:hypothetical protein
LFEKIHGKNKTKSNFGRLSKLAAVKKFPQLPMLVDFEQLFVSGFFGLEIWHTYN